MVQSYKLPLLIASICLSGLIIQAQETNKPEDAYVTTQDYSNLRLGPGENWEILTRLDYGVTLRATGRSFDNRWIQVMYEGDVSNPDDATIDGVTYGWVVYWLLVWTGDILELPVTSIETIRWARGPRRQSGITRSMQFPSGRLFDQLRQTIRDNENNWQDIAQRWRDLDSGFQTTCNNIPPLTVINEKRFTEKDLAVKTEYIPVVEILKNLVDNMNNAIILFQSVCNREESQRFATPIDVTTAFIYIEEADRQRNIINFFLIPLQRNLIEELY